MRPRKTPTLATWLLNRLGLARENPPLVGDLLEEFHTGRSSAWFWRQTLVVIVTAFARNARRYRRLLIARLIGWSAAGAVSFGLWRWNLPPRLNALIAFGSGLTLALLWLLLAVRRRGRLRESDADSSDAETSDADTLDSWGELDEEFLPIGRRILMRAFIGTWFLTCLLLYGMIGSFVALLGAMPLWAFVLFQTQLLVSSVTDVLAPTNEPGLAVRLLTRQ